MCSGVHSSVTYLIRDCSEFLVRGGGVWAMAGVQGKVAFGLSRFVY